MILRARGRAGFVLVEALTAFAIVAFATLVLQRSLVQSSLAARVGADREAAEWLVRDLLAAPLSGAEVNAGGQTGTIGGMPYEIRLVPLHQGSTEWPLPTAPPSRERQGTSGDSGTAEARVQWLPVRMRVTVQTAQRRVLTVETIRLAAFSRRAPSAAVGD